MKYENLYNRETLEAAYADQFGPFPELPQYTSPLPSNPQGRVLRAGSTRIITEPPKASDGSYRIRDEASVSITLLQGKDHLSVQLDHDLLGDLISELQRISVMLADENHARQSYSVALNNAEQSRKTYQELRENALKHAVNMGNFTEEQLRNPEVASRIVAKIPPVVNGVPMPRRITNEP